MIDYLKDPAEIYRRSFAIVRKETALDTLPPDIGSLAVRLVHACGDPEITANLAWDGDVVSAARRALVDDAPVLADCRMVVDGVIARNLPAQNHVICTLNDPETDELAAREATTRSAAAVTRWEPHLSGALVAIGNAPTALFRLLELLESGGPRPAAIFAFPVGFVGAEESKEALIDMDHGVPYLTLRGRRGGSAMAAAAINALSAEQP